MRMIFALVLSLVLAASATAGGVDDRKSFQPDLYPSELSAARGLAMRSVEILSAAQEFCEDADAIEIDGDAGSDAITALSLVLKREFPRVKVELLPASSAGKATMDVVQARLRLTGQTTGRSPFGSGRTLNSGTVCLELEGAGVHEVLTSQFIDKPWADDWNTFISSEPKGRWITGVSETPAARDRDALDEARQAAAAKLWPRVRDRMNAKNASRAGAIKVGEQWVRARLEALLRQERFLTDSLVQCIERPYGKVWQASILVDASSANIDALAADCTRQARAEFGAKAVTAGSMAGMVGVIVLLYFFVNAVTKGYFVWRLRAVALLSGIAGILIVLAVR